MGNHRFVQPPMLLSVRMEVCLENCLNTYTCFQPFGLMPGLVSEHPAEGVYFQSHIRITLQINNDILELVSLLRQVAARCGGLLHQAVRFPCAVPRDRHELQPSREGTAAAFFREKGDGIALQTGATDRRTRKTEP